MGAAHPKNQKQSREFRKQTLSYTSCCMQGWRKSMEDTIIAISPFHVTCNNEIISLFGVFDGHGGSSVANFVQENFPKELFNNQSFQRGDYETALKESLMKMDDLLEIRQKQEAQNLGNLEENNVHSKELENIQDNKQNTNFDQCGCTAIVCLITNGFIYTANIGDSRAVACQKIPANISNEYNQPQQPPNSTPQRLFYYVQKQLSEDHKPDCLKQKNRIQKAGGIVKDGRINGQLNLSRAIGDLKYKRNQSLSKYEQTISAQPDIVKIPTQNIEYLIIGCDGIWQVKTAADMVQWINERLDNLDRQIRLNKQRSNMRMRDILQQLLDQLIAKNKNEQSGKDNMSAILVKLQDRRSQWFKRTKKINELQI